MTRDQAVSELRHQLRLSEPEASGLLNATWSVPAVPYFEDYTSLVDFIVDHWHSHSVECTPGCRLEEGVN